MGVSTNAMLYYGIPFEEDDERLEYDENSEEEEQHELAQALYESTDLGGVTIETHCSYDFPMYIASIDSHVAYRGEPVRIKTLTTPSAHERAKLQAFAKKYKLDYSKAGWYLCSMWG